MSAEPSILTIPVSPGRYVRVAAGWPLSPMEWGGLLAVLDVMRPGLVIEPEPEDPTGAPDPAVPEKED